MTPKCGPPRTFCIISVTQPIARRADHGLRRAVPATCDFRYDSLAMLEHIRRSGADYKWFDTIQSIVEKEFALSGLEQNPDITNTDRRLTLNRASVRATAASLAIALRRPS